MSTENKAQKAHRELKKNANGWFVDQDHQIYYHMVEVKQGKYVLPCGMALKGGDIVSYFVENVKTILFEGKETLAVSGVNFSRSTEVTMIPIEILDFNRNQQLTFAAYHPEFPKDFFELRVALAEAV